MWCRAVAIGLLAGMLLAPAAGARTYKWVDDKGVTHYGDRPPPQLVTAPKATVRAPSADELRAKEDEAKRLTEQKRQDTALLATYASEREIEEARARDLKRLQDWVATNSAGLAKSKSDADRKRLDALMEQSRKETDAINAKYDGFKARFMELKTSRSG